MASCMICKKEVTTGYVLCGCCVHKLEPLTLPTELAYFIDQLAEDIVLDEKICPCDMCSIGECMSQVSGLVCRNGVKAWLLSKADKYLKPANKSQVEK